LTAATVLAEIALANFAKEPRLSLYTSWQMLAAMLGFVLAFSCFLGAIERWPFPPWAKLGFPKILIGINATGNVEAQRQVTADWQVPACLWWCRLQITNHEKEQNANLTIRLYFKLRPHPDGRIKEVMATSRLDWPTDPKLGLHPLPESINLSPGETASGDVIYEIHGTMEREFLAKPLQVRMEIEDHVSGKTMNKMIQEYPSRFASRDMQPSPGPVRVQRRISISSETTNSSSIIE
jgi:hypothetical protein